jgi:hypothetical protein
MTDTRTSPETAEVRFGFASYKDGKFELIAINIKTGEEITLEGQLRPDQTLEQIDKVLPTCVYVNGVAQEGLNAPTSTSPETAAYEDTDDAEVIKILAAVRHCANSWDGSARLIGNVRARDISRACTAAITSLAQEGLNAPAYTPTNRELHDAIATAMQQQGLTYSGIQEAVKVVQNLYASSVSSTGRK